MGRQKPQGTSLPWKPPPIPLLENALSAFVPDFPLAHFPEAPNGLFNPPTADQSCQLEPPTAAQQPPILSSPLVPYETTVSGFNPGHAAPIIDDPHAQLHLGFRHSCWLPRRQRTLTCLQHSLEGKNSIDRFCACGSVAWVMKSDDLAGRHRLQVNRCRNRWCIPCATEKARMVARNVKEFVADRTVRFLTFTLKSNDQPLSAQLDRLYKTFKKLRHLPQFKRALTGGVIFFEVKLNKTATAWHPHLHVLAEGSYIDARSLSKTWLELTGDSFIVDIRQVPPGGAVAGYVAKYAGKALEARTWDFPDRLVEAMVAFRGRRFFTTFGSWVNCDLSKRPEDDCGWIAVGPLHVFMSRAAAGDAYAASVIRSLSRSDANVVDYDQNPDTS